MAKQRRARTASGGGAPSAASAAQGSSQASDRARPSGSARPRPEARPGSASKPAARSRKATEVAATPPAPPAPTVDHAALRARKLVALAEVARPHGIAGELRLKVYNPDSDVLLRRPRVLLALPDGTERHAVIASARAADRGLLVRFAEVLDRDAAEAIRGAAVCVPRSTLPPPEEGEFYAWDVEGARAVLTSGEEVGRVLELTSYPSCSVLVVTRPDQSRIEVPLVPAYVARVDTDASVVELITVDGLD